MKTSPEIQKLVEDLCTEHKIDLYQVGAYLKLNIGKENKYIPLVIERVAPMLVTVSHQYPDENGQIVKNPQVTFFTGYQEWVAIDILQPTSTGLTLDRFGGYHRFADLTNDGLAIFHYEIKPQANLAVFVKNWYKVLNDTNWLGRASNTAYVQTSFADGIVDADITPVETADDFDTETEEVEYRALPARRLALVSGN